MVSWWVPYLPKGCRLDFDNGLGGDSDSCPVLASGVYLSPTQIMAPPQATRILSQMKYTSGSSCDEFQHIKFCVGANFWMYSAFFLTLPVWEFYWNLAFVNFITLIALRWFGQFIMSGQLFLEIKLIAFLYISNSKRTGAQSWNSQTWFKLKWKPYRSINKVTSRSLALFLFCFIHFIK